MIEILNLVKDLRERTGAGFVDCKKALSESKNNIDIAIEILRKKGLSTANKKSLRDANEGVVCINFYEKHSTIMEVNTETDFAAKNIQFINFIKELIKISLGANNIDELLMIKNNENITVEEMINNTIAKIGENIVLKRFYRMEEEHHTKIFGYVHNSYEKNIGKIACLLKIKSDKFSDELVSISKNICMHIAAMKPLALDISDLDDNLISKEREILFENIKSLNKSEKIVESILDGKIKKFYEDVVLLEQKYIIDNETKIKD